VVSPLLRVWCGYVYSQSAQILGDESASAVPIHRREHNEKHQVSDEDCSSAKSVRHVAKHHQSYHGAKEPGRSEQAYPRR
jgi:hypothetical protein